MDKEIISVETENVENQERIEESSMDIERIESSMDIESQESPESLERVSSLTFNVENVVVKIISVASRVLGRRTNQPMKSQRLLLLKNLRLLLSLSSREVS